MLLLWSEAPAAKVKRAKIVQNRVGTNLDFDIDIDVRLWQSNCFDNSHCRDDEGKAVEKCIFKVRLEA
jgi:hypothetical protein